MLASLGIFRVSVFMRFELYLGSLCQLVLRSAWIFCAGQFGGQLGGFVPSEVEDLPGALCNDQAGGLLSVSVMVRLEVILRFMCPLMLRVWQASLCFLDWTSVWGFCCTHLGSAVNLWSCWGSG